MLDIFTKVVLAGACLFSFAWVILAQRRTIKRLSDAYLRLTHLQRVLAALVVIVCTVYAQKPSTNDVNGVTGTNQVEIVEGGTNEVGGIVLNTPQPMPNGASFFGGCGPLGTTAPTVAVLPYRLEYVSTNSDISYEMPADGAIRGTWHLTGAYEDVQKVALDGFAFPLGSDLCASLWAYTWGKVRSRLRGTGVPPVHDWFAQNGQDARSPVEIAVVGVPMSAIPEVSRFWTAATSNDTYLLTWENFAAGRVRSGEDAASPFLSAQIELFRNGDFITRSNNVESVWRRRMPCDLDEDGWIDLIDPDPVFFGEDGFGPHQTLPEGDNTNYYYWVDLVVDQANARVTFEGDDFSTLPDPDFIARAGETNRVMLLIGKAYVVRCDLPIRCVNKEDDEVCVWSEGRSLGILWPIYLEFVPSEPLLLLAGPLLGASPNGGGDTGVFVHPERAGGGSFSWENDFCCCSTSRDGSPIFCCDGTCGCGGCYTGDITYLIGGHGLIFGGWYCACSSDPDDPHGGDEPPDGPLAGPCVSATFSADAVIFEDEYENMPGQTMPRRSTETEVEFYAYGGTNGGTYAFSMVNESKLRRLGGAYLPKTGTVRAGESFRIKVRYEALSASGSEGDIKARAEFTEFETNRKLPDVETPLTSVKVELEAEHDAPANSDSHRHIYGVAERVYYHVFPVSMALSITLPDGFNHWDGGSFVCPWTVSGSGESYNLAMSCSSVQYNVPVRVLKPVIVAYNQRVNDATNVVNVVGEAGHLLLCQDLYATPFYVSFAGVQFREVPDESQSGSHSGYYDDRSKGGNWSHTQNDGAGEWWGTRSSGYFASDKAGRRIAYSTPWVFGSKEWAIPMEWGNGGSLSFRFNPDPTTQRFTLQPTGTFKIEKFGHNAERNVLGLFWLDGLPLLW